MECCTVKNKIQVDIDLSGHNLACETTFAKVISEKILLNKVKFYDRMALVSQQYDDRASVLIDTFEVSDTLFNKLTGQVNVEFDWHSYYGFEDVHQGEKIKDTWIFNVKNNVAMFEIELPEMHVVHEI